ncbi:kynureninase [Noviherbaspirillum aridicola]|uniref:Kynureninase n=1 Tax=Noviherbaspirillum aridicola TaxID=2849687 RepID=A0ABQ4Q8P2_9BURK|nr:kynureninase [Noviherbaspirillum aridicola]GIZ53583.1 kynureninase [Noviherbaspirillum aridicola]
MSLSREHCLALDAHDELAALRSEFELPRGVIYLDGNSLGARPCAALERARELIGEEWGNGLIRSWNKAGWFTLPTRLGDKLAPLVGAGAGQVVVTDSTSVNLFKVLAAALHSQAERDDKRKVIVSERSNFPTDLYIAQGLAAWLDRGYRLRLVDSPAELAAAVDDSTAVLMLTHVNYRTGHMHDMEAMSALAHERGALAVWDLAHSAGAVPLALEASGADYAVGCTYKYLNGGPGAPAFLWVAPRHLAGFRQPLSGWWAHASPFVMQPEFSPAPDIRRALCGTQPIASLAMVECGLDIFLRTDMQRIRAKSLALTDLFIRLVEQRCAHHPLELVTPRDHGQRGSQVSFAHPHGYAVMQALIGRGVIGDYREPGIMRFGFTPLYTRFVDVWDAVDILADILDNRAYDTEAPRDAVT